MASRGQPSRSTQKDVEEQETAEARPDFLPGLTIVQGNRLEKLAERLAEFVRQPLHSPFEPEHVVVPNLGMARWLSLALADRLGICLNVRFSLPASFVWDVWRNVLPDVPEELEWSASVLGWRVFGELARADGPVFEPLTRSLAGADPLGRFELARHIGEVFDQYLVYRGDRVLEWESGRGHERTMHAQERWQAELWRRLVAARPARHRAQLAREFAARATSGRLPLERLPRRLSIFGIPALAPAYLEMFDALSRSIEVQLFLLNPCRQYWGHVVAEREIGRRAGEQDPAELYLESGNHLLASLGQQGRDFVEMVIERGAHTIDVFEEPPDTSLLALLQADILELRCRGTPEVPPLALAPEDRSVRIHVCHTAMREVEVLHDQLLDLFATNPDLGPADVRVLTPDIETFAPLVEAVFGTAPPERRIPYSIADRVPQSESASAAAFLSLLAIPSSRHDAAGVLSLLEATSIRRRFEIDDDDLARINAWVRTSGIRWGIDAAGRAALDLPATHENTWRFGLDRLMLGYAMPGDDRRLFEGILPSDDVEGVSAQIMGRLHHYAETLFASSAELAEPRPLAEWKEYLERLLALFFDPEPNDEGFEAVQTAIADLAEDATRAEHREPVPLEIVRTEIERRLTSPGAVGAFLSGAVTFCTMLPMRNLPAQVICLIGMNDGAYPRSHRTPGFDLMTHSYRRGDRSRRDDDRYLFLEAMLAARRCLYVSYVGRGVRDNAPIPPSVLVSELEDAIRTGFRSESGKDGLAQVSTVHPLQPFSRRYFAPGSELSSFSRELCEAAARGEAVARPPSSVAATPFLVEDLPRADDEWKTIHLDRLLRFFRHPQRFFLKERLGVVLDEAEALIDSQEPFRVEALDLYRLREALLELHLGRERTGSILELMRASGVLPHGRVGESLLFETSAAVERFATRLVAEGGKSVLPPQTIDLTFGDMRLVGALGHIAPEGIVDHRLGQADARFRLSLWIQHLVLHAHTRAKAGFTSRLIAEDQTVTLHPVADAEQHLAGLLDFYWRGIHHPLEFSPRLSAKCLERGDPKHPAVLQMWAGDRNQRGEADDRYLALAFRGRDLLTEEFLRIAREILGPITTNEGAR